MAAVGRLVRRKAMRGNRGRGSEAALRPGSLSGAGLHLTDRGGGSLRSSVHKQACSEASRKRGCVYGSYGACTDPVTMRCCGEKQDGLGGDA